MVKNVQPGRGRLAVRLGIALMIGTLGLAGCGMQAQQPPPPVPVTVRVPVPEPVYCPAPDETRPALPIAGLSERSSPADTMRAYAASIVILKGAVEERDQILRGCTREAAAAHRSGSSRFALKRKP